ncbi:hypothetical protein FF38_10976 [Lucilia cuprina]|uniref:Uncharacterized protein n=1 Tax=Lucilia cuprina TaxID=7375 RepID=A0A0L0BXH1_LUCCU|nr:hypothetical protein FF38_10976 [Lucilia cuprina]
MGPDLYEIWQGHQDFYKKTHLVELYHPHGKFCLTHHHYKVNNLKVQNKIAQSTQKILHWATVRVFRAFEVVALSHLWPYLLSDLALATLTHTKVLAGLRHHLLNPKKGLKIKQISLDIQKNYPKKIAKEITLTECPSGCRYLTFHLLIRNKLTIKPISVQNFGPDSDLGVFLRISSDTSSFVKMVGERKKLISD